MLPCLLDAAKFQRGYKVSNALAREKIRQAKIAALSLSPGHIHSNSYTRSNPLDDARDLPRLHSHAKFNKLVYRSNKILYTTRKLWGTTIETADDLPDLPPSLNPHHAQEMANVQANISADILREENERWLKLEREILRRLSALQISIQPQEPAFF